MIFLAKGISDERIKNLLCCELLCKAIKLSIYQRSHKIFKQMNIAEVDLEKNITQSQK